MSVRYTAVSDTYRGGRFGTLTRNSSALLGPSLDKFEKIRIKVGLVLVAICDKTEYTN